MKYENIVTGIFRERPNRFIAMVEIDGKIEVCHVKNTGRCKELLVPNATVYLEKSNNPARKTAFDLIGVNKGDTYINMDSQAPNKMAYEWLKKQEWDYIKPEYRYGNSRLDFYMERRDSEDHLVQKAFMEVKGVTLETGGVARFPDAPTERGVKHIEELIKIAQEGYEAYILFVIQMKGIRHFEPNDDTHPAFGEALRKAREAGVKILAFDCEAKPGTVFIDSSVEVKLE